MAEGTAVTTRFMRLWDAPTRVFHWLLVLLVIGSLVTVEAEWPDIPLPGGGRIAHMTLHIWCGLAILVLVIFRIGWGFVGSSTARFSHFVRGPGAIMTYVGSLRRKPPLFVAGHNPLGALMVLALLADLLVQAVTGLFSKDEDDFYDIAVGPLHTRVSEATGKFLNHIHHLNGTVVQVLIYVHIAAAVLYWLVLRENLIGAMVTGRRPLPLDAAPGTVRFVGPGRALVLLGASIVLVWAFVTFFPK
jgi:cytochrome b